MSDCLFCKIVAKEIPAQVVYEDEQVLAFRDIEPKAPVHILIIPKQHISGVTDLAAEHEVLTGHVFTVTKAIARQESVFQCGFRVVVNSGPDAGQAVDHIHFHLLGGRKLSWPPG